MVEESNKQVELDKKGEVPTMKSSSPTHQYDGGNDSSSRNSLSSGTPGSVPKMSPNRADCYWFAQSGDKCSDSPNDSENSKEKERERRDREERVKLLREKQSEERHRKLEELKTAAFQAQKFREQQEEERRKKIDEIKSKDLERRHLVEERKRQIMDAEMDRRENLLRRSQDREAKIEAQRNAHRSSIGFAFGSSTPRMLDAESALLLNSRRTASQVLLYHPTNRSTSGNNGTATNSKETTDGVVRRRLGTSHSVDRGVDPAQRHTIHESFFYGTAETTSVNPNLKSVNKTYHSAAFPWEMVESPISYTTADITMSGLLHGSGVLVGENIMTQSLTSLSTYSRGRRKTDLIPTVPIPKESPRTRSPAASSPSRPQSSMSQQSLSSHSTSSITLRAKTSKPKPRPLSVAGSAPNRNNELQEQRQGRSVEKKVIGMPPTGRPPRAKSVGADNVLKEVKPEEIKSSPPPVPAKRNNPQTKAANTSPAKDKPKIPPKPNLQKLNSNSSSSSSRFSPPSSPSDEEAPNPLKEEAKQSTVVKEIQAPEVASVVVEKAIVDEVKEIVKEESEIASNNDTQTKVEEDKMPLVKPKITTEEEAKAILAEKRRKAREQAEREAELERQRQEQLQREEEERIRREEEAQRLWELEVERQRLAEEERLQKAIQEQQKREEEERLKREEEQRLKAEREKAELLSREEQERARKEAEEKFNREEEERAKRRKRVEDIMSRTRARDKAKKDAETPTQNIDMISSFTESVTLKTDDGEKNDISNGVSNPNNMQEETLVELDTIQTNGFNNHHHVNNRDYHTNNGESIMDSPCISGFDLLSPNKMNPTSNYDTSNASSATNISNMGDHLSNEDNVNFNILTTTNGIDNFPTRQETGVTDLLS